MTSSPELTPPPRPVGIGVIGCGQRSHALVPQIMRHAPQHLIVRALYDPNPKYVDLAKQRYAPNAEVCDTFQQVAEHPGVDWLFIASPNCYHKEHVLAAFAAGKDVFCEKPLATSAEDCIAMLDAQRTSNKRFILGFTLRFSAHYRTLKKLLDDDEIGQPISLEFNETLMFFHGALIHGDWRRHTQVSGGYLLEKCCHDMDLINWLVDSRPARVASFSGLDYFRPENAGEIERIGKWKDRDAFLIWQNEYCVNPFTDDKDIVDNQVAILEYENRVRASFHTNTCTGIQERRIYMCGTKGSLRADLLTGQIEVQRFGVREQRKQADSQARDMHGGGDQVLCKEVAECMLYNRPVSATLESGLLSAMTIIAIDQAVKEQRVVDLAPLWEAAGV